MKTVKTISSGLLVLAMTTAMPSFSQAANKPTDDAPESDQWQIQITPGATAPVRDYKKQV